MRFKLTDDDGEILAVVEATDEYEAIDVAVDAGALDAFALEDDPPSRGSRFTRVNDWWFNLSTIRVIPLDM